MVNEESIGISMTPNWLVPDVIVVHSQQHSPPLQSSGCQVWDPFLWTENSHKWFVVCSEKELAPIQEPVDGCCGLMTSTLPLIFLVSVLLLLTLLPLLLLPCCHSLLLLFSFFLCRPTTLLHLLLLHRCDSLLFRSSSMGLRKRPSREPMPSDCSERPQWVYFCLSRGPGHVKGLIACVVYNSITLRTLKNNTLYLLYITYTKVVVMLGMRWGNMCACMLLFMTVCKLRLCYCNNCIRYFITELLKASSDDMIIALCLLGFDSCMLTSCSVAMLDSSI